MRGAASGEPVGDRLRPPARMVQGESAGWCADARSVSWSRILLRSGERWRVLPFGHAQRRESRRLRPPGHGDYEAEASIDWDEAIPDLVAAGLTRDPKLAERWRSLPLVEARRRLNEVLRARKPSVRAERSLKLLADLEG